jgi:hypothetical protein
MLKASGNFTTGKIVGKYRAAYGTSLITLLEEAGVAGPMAAASGAPAKNSRRRKLMLFDPKWEEPKVPSLDGFIEWLRTKAQDEPYDWVNPVQCACAQYARDIGCYDAWLNHREAWTQLNGIAHWGGSDRDGWNFGLCLAEALKAKQLSRT